MSDRFQTPHLSLPVRPFLSAESFLQPGIVPAWPRVAAYIRVSTELSDQENSYATQEAYFRRLLEQNPLWISAGVYADYGISGTSHEKRAGFQRLLRHCREGKVDRIICKSISRFARNTKDFLEALGTLSQAGATILFEKEGLDTGNAISIFILTTLAAIAQEESHSISANVRWSYEKRFPQGDVPNQSIYGYRFAQDRCPAPTGSHFRAVEIVPEEAAVVRWVFAQAAQGLPYAQIARALNHRHIPPRLSPYAKRRLAHAKKGQLDSSIQEGWTAEQISRMVKNERYTGDVLAQKTYTPDYLTHRSRPNRGEVPQYLVKSHHPAIVSQEQFQAAAWRAARPVKARGDRARHTLSGRLICGGCGRFYHVRNVHGQPVWYCPTASRNNGQARCPGERVREAQLIPMLRQAAVERFPLAVSLIPENAASSDIVSERFRGAPPAFFPFQMARRLEALQRMDFVERDRLFLKGRLLAAGEGAEREALARHLQYLEDYWAELEADQGIRDRAIRWIKGLSPGAEGAAEFLQGMTGPYVGAFVLSVTIHTPLRYTLHWFDDTRTEVELLSGDSRQSPEHGGRG